MKPFKNKAIDFNEDVLVYRNLHMKGKWYSIRQGGVVVAHCQNFILSNCTFVINNSGKKEAIKTGIRNVHAFICGKLSSDISNSFSFNLRYKPFESGGFYINVGEDKKYIDTASFAYTSGDNIFVQF